LSGDIVGLVNAVAETGAVIVGHDWGSAVAWFCALLRPAAWGVKKHSSRVCFVNSSLNAATNFSFFPFLRAGKAVWSGTTPSPHGACSYGAGAGRRVSSWSRCRVRPATLARTPGASCPPRP
jgi:pimeloyl-ACP methyl ester carboxylesterase